MAEYVHKYLGEDLVKTEPGLALIAGKKVETPAEDRLSLG